MVHLYNDDPETIAYYQGLGVDFVIHADGYDEYHLALEASDGYA